MTNSIAEVQRAISQAELVGNREQLRLLRQHERALRAIQKQEAANERERKRLYVESREHEIAQRNAELHDRLEQIQNILGATLLVDDRINFSKLLKFHQPQAFHPSDDLTTANHEPVWSEFEPEKPNWVKSLIGGKRQYSEALVLAEKRFSESKSAHLVREQERLSKLETARDAYGQKVWEEKGAIEKHNAEVKELERSYTAGEPGGIVEYFNLVLTISSYPDSFPQRYRIAYTPESRQLVIEYELPTIDAIPSAKDYRYIKTRDEIVIVPRPLKEIKSTYGLLIGEVTLRTIHEIFEADQGNHIDTVTFNGMVTKHDPGTGQLISPCVVSLRTTKESFNEINLSLVDPISCLGRLNASVSRKPEELTGIRPVVEFDMVDKRFIQETDVLSELDHRPNLLQLSPSEFESLIQNLFSKMGQETKLTRPSRDGGIDCVAFDSRPVFGGKVVIQAKRYKNTVDVSAVRDLFGSMQNEGANKGILVTTSGYGPTSYEFASGKPLELIDGSALLYLLEEYAGVKARIDFVD